MQKQLVIDALNRLALLRERIREMSRDESGATVVETTIITAAFAALAIAVMLIIKALVDAKIAGISL